MCCPCRNCGKCRQYQGCCVVCHEKLPEMFSVSCPKCGAPQPPAPGMKLAVHIDVKLD